MLELTEKTNIESFIGNNLETLEKILNKRSQKYLVMQKEKEKYNFGQNLNPERLREIAKEVIQNTNDLLKIGKTPSSYLSMFYLPKEMKRGTKIALGAFTMATLVGFLDGATINDLQVAGSISLLFGTGGVIHAKRDHLDSCYLPSDKTMRIGEKKEVNAVAEIAHEYTHHLQHSLTNLSRTTKNPIKEGHARGIEGIIAHIFAQRHDNPAYAFEHTNRTAKELKDAYLFICRKKGIKSKESLANLPIPKKGGFLHKWLGCHYSLGVSAMEIAEAQHGNKVYRDVLDNNLSFLRA